MAHQRQQIRDALYGILYNTLSVGTNVFKNRSVPLYEDQLPAIMIYTNNEEITGGMETSPREYTRKLSVGVEIISKQGVDTGPNVYDVIDDISFEVENKIEELPFLGLDFVNYIVLVGVIVNQSEANSEKEIDSVILHYEVEYITEIIPSLTKSTIGNYVKAYVDYEQPPADIDKDASDVIDIPQ